jgi:hypothetical protein
MAVHYSAGEFFILETSFGGGFDYPKFVRKHVALRACSDVDIPDSMQRYGEWLARTGKAAAALLVEHHFGKDYSDNVDGDGFVAWLAAQGKVELLTSNVVKISVEAYEGGDVRLSADDGLDQPWKQVLDDPAPRSELVAWQETFGSASPAAPVVESSIRNDTVNLNAALKRSLDLGCDLGTAVAAQLVERQFTERADWQDQKGYRVTVVQDDGEEHRERQVRIEIKQPTAYEGSYTVQINRYVRKGMESFGFHATQHLPTSLEANQLSLLVLSGSILPADVHNIYEIHSADHPLTIYKGEHDQFQGILAAKKAEFDVVRSKVTGELGLMVRESLDDYEQQHLYALPSYQKLREDMKVPVHILDNWPGAAGSHIGAFVSSARLLELSAISWGVFCMQGDLANRINALRP